MPDPLSELQRLGQEFDADGVEAVARAICEVAGVNPDEIYEDFDRNAGASAWVTDYPEGWEAETFPRTMAWQDYVIEARAAIEAARPMIEKEAWRPIESAPKDGTWIAVTSMHNPYYRATIQWHSGAWIDAFEANHGGFMNDTATHWMPLPAPPAIRALGDRVG